VSRDGSCIVWHEEAGKEPAGFGDNARIAASVQGLARKALARI
jgi:hypothetical protein